MQVVIDMTRPAEKQMILEFVRKLDGLHRRL
jgi:hypothetical protein